MSPHFLLTGPGGHCRLCAATPAALYAALRLALPPELRAGLSVEVERALCGGLEANPGRGIWRYGAFELRRLEVGE